MDGLSESDHELDDIHEQLAVSTPISAGGPLTSTLSLSPQDMRDPESRSRALTMAHKQCRLDIEDEAMHLSSLRNEREELERQLRAMMMGAGECDPVEEEDSEGLDEEEDSDIKRSPARYEVRVHSSSSVSISHVSIHMPISLAVISPLAPKMR